MSTLLPFLHALTAPDDVGLGRWFEQASLDEATINWLHAQGLAPFAFHRLRSAGLIERLAPEAHTALRQIYLRAVADATLHNRELDDVLAALAATGVTPALYKGAALAHTVYPDPTCRPMGDLDLWLTTEDLPRAQTALEAIGYVQGFREHRPPAIQATRQGQIQLCGRAGRGLVELHWGVFPGEWLYRTASIEDGAVWSRLQPIQVRGQSVLTLAPEDAIIQLAVHLAVNHQMGHPRLRGMMDIVLVARHQPVDWLTLAARARGWRVATATWLVLALAADMLALDEARTALPRLQPPPFQRALLARFVDTRSMLAMRDLRRGPQRFVYLLTLADRRRDALHMLHRAVWPEDAWLEARYGRNKPGTRLRHIAGVARGRP